MIEGVNVVSENNMPPSALKWRNIAASLISENAERMGKLLSEAMSSLQVDSAEAVERAFQEGVKAGYQRGCEDTKQAFSEYAQGKTRKLPEWMD